MSAFILEDGKLFVDTGSGPEAWVGTRSGIPISKVIELSDRLSAILLFDYVSWDKGEFMNVARIDTNGRILWEAQDTAYRLSGDVFIAIELIGERLYATSWFGKRFSVNLADGVISYGEFVK